VGKQAKTSTKPTIVLVHGAFADSSGWSLVAPALEAAGYPVIAFSNPLRGIEYDSQYLREFLSTIPGPIVLVGHSYGGALITNAATGNPNVKSLVYIAAYALAEGESVAAANELGGGHSAVTDHLLIRPFPGASEGDADAYIDPKFFPELFAQDLPKIVAKTMAASQRPGSYASLVSPSGVPAWSTIPSWYMVAKQDRIIPPEAERAMAQRANAKTVEVNTSHVPMISKPLSVISLISQAAK
jgi:pimeloyl-ACP methyl ester carboxylesterase